MWGMMSRFTGTFLAVMIFTAPVTAVTAAPLCKTLKGEWVGVGVGGTQKEAETRLEQALTSWGQRYSIASVRPKDRKVGCKVYLELLNEYYCAAEATVCR
jgi:hypothetical protein